MKQETEQQDGIDRIEAGSLERTTSKLINHQLEWPLNDSTKREKKVEIAGMRGDITTDFTGIKRVVRECYKNFTPI